MIVVADTSPLNYLFLIGHIEVLRDLYGTIFVPRAVWRELQSNATPSQVRDWFSSIPAWVEVRLVQSGLDPATENLGDGVREAIALSQEVDADWLIADDLAARTEAARRQINVIGTLGILRNAASAGLLNLFDAIEKLQQTSFYASPSLIRSLLEEDAAWSDLDSKTEPNPR